MEKKTFSIEEALRFGWDTFQANTVFFLILVAIIGIANVVPGQLADYIREFTPFWATFLDFAGWVLGIFVSIGLIKVSFKFVDKEKPKFSDLFLIYPLFFRYLFSSIVYGFVVFMGFLLLLVPGFIWLIKYSLFSYLIVDRGMGPLEALSASGKVTQGARFNLFLFGILFVFLNFLGGLAFLIGLFVTIPVTSLAAAWIYRKLISQTEGI